MTTATHPQETDLDAEYRGAVVRLDADLQIVMRAAERAGTETLDVLSASRRLVIAAYRTALHDAAGRPYDIAWRLLELTVAAFVERIPPGLRYEARTAAERLRSLADDNGS